MAQDPTELEQHRVEAPDGWPLWASEVPPVGDPRAIVIAGHAMMVNGRTLLHPTRPCLAHTLAAAGLHVLVPDLRGHGRSARGPMGLRMWRYDDLVDDTATWVALACALAPDLPVVTLGHSLFGHTTLAWMARTPGHPIVRHAMLAANLWTRQWTDSPVRWLRKRAWIELLTPLASVLGALPVRRLRIGTDDPSGPYWHALATQVRTGRWCADDGTDYAALLPHLDVPVLHVLTDGDPFLARPADAALFSAALPHRELWRITAADVGGASPPTHMGLATDPRCQDVWRRVAAWLRGPDD